MRKIYKLILLLISILNLCSCVSYYWYEHPEIIKYDYSEWKKVEIPTNTRYRGKVKIPKTWSFINEQENISIIDTNNGETIAQQVFQGWYTLIELEDKKYLTNWNKLEFNPNISLDISNEDYYFDKNFFDYRETYIKEFNDGINKLNCIFFKIYNYRGFEGNFELCLLFNENIEYKTIMQIAEAYYWFGTIND